MSLKMVEFSRPMDTATHLLVLLHGRGADEMDLLPLGSSFDPRFRIISVRAPMIMGGGYAWYSSASDTPRFTREISEATRELEKVLAGFDLPIVVLGFSQGGLVATRFAMTSSLQVAGVVSLSAPPLAESMVEKLDEMPVFWGHGTEDTVVVLDRGNVTLRHLTEAGAHVTARRYRMSHTICDQELLDINNWTKEILDQR